MRSPVQSWVPLQESTAETLCFFRLYPPSNQAIAPIGADIIATSTESLPSTIQAPGRVTFRDRTRHTSSAAKSLSHRRLAIVSCCILQQETAPNHLLTKHLGVDKEKGIFSLTRKAFIRKQMKAFIVLLNHFQASIFLQCLFRSRISWVCSLYSSKIHFGFSSSRMCSIPYLRARTMASSQSISNS